MPTDRIKAMIRDFNPWWEGKEIIVPEYKRHIFGDVWKYVRTKQIIAVVGLRRVGKTVLLKQVLKELKNVEKENIFYFLFDDLISQNPEILDDVLDYYLKTIAKDGKKYIFLDEIQKVPFWQDILKRYYDTKEDIKFMVSGSSSLEIKKSKESLAGRIYDFYLPALTFREFLELNGISIEKARLDFMELKKIYDANVHKKAKLEEMFREYVYRGAFPEIAREKDEDIIRNYIRNSVLEKVLFEDIPAVYDIKRKDVLFSIMEYCSRETSNLLDITNLAGILDANYQTVKSYIFYLRNSFMLDLIYNYSKSTAKQLRKNKKVHVVHPSVTVTIMRYSKDTINSEELMGRFAETVVFQHAKLLSERVSFFRTPQKEEVDLILENNVLLPVEVKYRKNVSDLPGLTKFMEKHKSRGIVVTKDILSEKEISGKKILFVPTWLFLVAV